MTAYQWRARESVTADELQHRRLLAYEAARAAIGGPGVYRPEPHPERQVLLDEQVVRCPVEGAWRIEGRPCPVGHS